MHIGDLGTYPNNYCKSSVSISPQAWNAYCVYVITRPVCTVNAGCNVLMYQACLIVLSKCVDRMSTTGAVV